MFTFHFHRRLEVRGRNTSFAQDFSFFLIMNDLADDDSITLSLSNLPRLTLKDIENADDCCPICLIPYRTILEQLVEDEENNCVTKIEGCGHVFCIQE